MSRYAAVLVLLATTWVVATASRATAATAPPLTLTWDVPTGAACPDRDYVVREVESLLKGSTGTAVRADVTISRRPDGGLHMKVVTYDDGEEPSVRELDSTDCRALADSAALFLALAINPDAGETVEPPASASVSASVPAPRPVPRPDLSDLPPERTRRRQRDVELAMWVAPLLAVGASPAPAFGGSAGIGGKLGPLWTGLAGSVTPMRSYALDVRPGNLLVSSYALQPHAGVRLGAQSWFEATAGVEVALVGASYDSIATSTPSRMLRISPSLGAAVMIPLSRSVVLRMFATALLPVVRPRYTVTVEGSVVELYRSPLVLGLAGVGLEIRP